MEIVVKGRIPSKKNSRISTRSGRTFPSANYTAWHKDASFQLKKFSKNIHYPENGISLKFYFPDHRRCDLTNKAESIMDLLVDNGFLEDDAWQKTGLIELSPGGVDKENPRCEISL